ncbi:MAG: hypothetical protein ACLGHP_07120 [Vicinamibacteria bacterium]
MSRIAFGVAAAVLCAAAMAAGVGATAQSPMERFLGKVAAILAHAEAEPPTPRRTTITESEVNSYLALGAAEHLPPSVTRPTLALMGEGRVSASAIVDLDVVRGQGTGGWLDPTAYLRGRVPVSAVGVVDARGGEARLTLERTEINGVAVPPFLLQEIVSFYTSSAESPYGVRLDQPFPLPARITAIEFGRGQAVVVQ